MDLDESLFTRLGKKSARPVLTRSLSDSGPEEARDPDVDSDAGTPRGLSCDSLLVPETPSPILQRCKYKRERENQPNQDEDSDSKRSRAGKKNFDRFMSPFKPADIKNKERKEALEKLRLAREKRLPKIPADSDQDEDSTQVKHANNGYKYSHFGTGYLGWPSDSESDSEDNEDDVSLREVIEERAAIKPEVNSSVEGIHDHCNRTKHKLDIQTPSSVFRKIKEESKARTASASAASSGKLSDISLRNNLESDSNDHQNCLSKFLSPLAEAANYNSERETATVSLDNREAYNVENSSMDLPCDNPDVKPKTLPANRRRILFPKKEQKRRHPPHSSNEPPLNDVVLSERSEPDGRPACRFDKNHSFRPASALLNEGFSLRNSNDLVCTPSAPRGHNSCYDQLPNGDVSQEGYNSTSLRNSKPQPGAFTSPETASGSREPVVDTIDLTRSDSPTFWTPPPNATPGMDRFQTPTHSRLGMNQSLQALLAEQARRSRSPDSFPLGVYHLSANRNQESDLSISIPSVRNRTGSRRHPRLSGLRRSRVGIVNNSDEGISPTTTRLMSEVSVSTEADEAVTLVRQMEDDEQYARRLQEEMDKEFAMSLHQADAGFVQSDHSGAFGAEEVACPPALSPTFLQYCRSPVRRRGYNSRQPGSRRRRGAAAAEPDEVMMDDELVVDGAGYEPNRRSRFPPGSEHPLVLMEAHIMALLDNSSVMRRGRRRGNNGGRFFRNVHSPVGDGNDYEELLELAESLGEVKQKGMTKSQLNRLPTSKFKRSEVSKDESTDCLICMCDYQEGDNLRVLPCCHEFHLPCIDKWLKNTATCPICRIDVKNS